MTNVTEKFLKNILYTLQDISLSLRKIADIDEPVEKSNYIPPWAGREKDENEKT